MADIGANEWHDDDEDGDDEEDDIDFVPGMGDEQLEDEYVDEDDDEDDEDEFPTLLEAMLFRDPSKNGNLCLEQEGQFCLVLQDSLPDSFHISSPILDTPLKFAGWIQSPGTWYEFDVIFSERLEPDDSMVLQFLAAQDEMKRSATGQSETVAVKGGKLTGEEDDDDESNQKLPPGDSLKAPPSYDSDGKKPASSSSSGKVTADVGDGKKVGGTFIFTMSATQTGGDQATDDSSKTVTFHGSFRKPDVSDDKVYVLCPVKLTDTDGGEARGGSAAVAGSATAAAGSGAAAASRKRSRSDRDGGDDDSVVEEGTGGVLNELIGLHDDAHLSTEELRAKYYGGGAAIGGIDDDRKKPPLSKSSNDFDDDDDDDIGF